MDFRYEVKVPKDRVAVLIGEKGNVKRKIEKAFNVKLDIDSEEGDVFLVGSESFDVYRAEKVVKAIGRGFNPEIALKLQADDFVFELVDITDFASDRKNVLQRVRGRIIGTEGKCRELIERISGVNIVIKGKTVALIGHYEWVNLARQAVESILNGRRHSSVYSWLEKESRKLRISYKM